MKPGYAEAIQNSDGRPLRICLLTYRGNPTCGGQGVYIKRISRALRDLGHTVHVVSGPPYPDLDPDIPLHRLPSLDLYNQDALFRFPTFREILSPINDLEWLGISTWGFSEPLTFGIRAYHFLRENYGAFDVVHDNQCLSYGLLGIKRLGIPTVATIHHPITVDRETELRAAKSWLKKIKVRRWYSFVGMQKRVARRLSHIITVSECSKEGISEEFRVPSNRFRVIPNGIDTDIFHPLPQVKRDHNRIMVTSSADTPLKGLRYLLEAVASIARDREIKLTVIGRLKRNGVVDRLVRELDLGRSVQFTDRIADRDFAYYYARSTMAVVPSLYEGFGFPAGEAMACGIPVISTTGGALPEVVGDAGVFVPPADSRALKSAIISLMDNPARRRELSIAGLERVRRNFMWESISYKLEKVYRETINANGRFLQT